MDLDQACGLIMSGELSVIGSMLRPSKIFCVGRNYSAHAAELGNPVPKNLVFFLKPPSSICEELYAFKDEPLHYELEICFVVIGGELAAVGLGVDLTKRGLQSELKAQGLPWERAKAFDGAAVFSPFIALPASLDKLSLVLEINGELRQAGGVDSMLYPPAVILTEAKTFMTLEDGDVIMTGTPAGVGQIYVGDRFDASLFDDNERILTKSWHAV